MKKTIFIILGILLLIVAGVLFFFQSDTKNPYQSSGHQTTEWGKFSGTCPVDELPADEYGNKFHPCDYSVPQGEIPTFKKASFPFKNKYDTDRSLPLAASCMIDINGDGVDEVFMSGGYGEADAIFTYDNGNFKKSPIQLASRAPNTTTFGATSFDLDNDNKTDLIVTGDYGVVWHRNTGNGFEAKKLEIPFNEKSTGASITFGDINRDGHADMFVSSYVVKAGMEGITIFKDPNYGGSSLMMINKGDNTFEDATARMGLTYVHNTFTAVLVDVDNDSYLDLVVAHDTGEVRTYKNEGGQKFTMKPNPTTGKYAYPMGIAVGDYNNDGNIDFFFSNTGTSVPDFLARGDLAEEDVFISDWLLFRNDGNFKFTDVAKETKVADFEFSWGAVFEDFNLDGKQDLVVVENYADFPPHKLFKLPGRFLLQRNDGTFSAVEDQAKVKNQNFGITPLSSDFNQDGYPDLVYTNLGGPVQAHINNGGDANYFALRMPENVKYAGARITLTKADGSTLTDAYVLGEGLASDQTSTITFGLGQDTSVKSVSIALTNGTTENVPNPTVNTLTRL